MSVLLVTNSKRQPIFFQFCISGAKNYHISSFPSFFVSVWWYKSFDFAFINFTLFISLVVILIRWCLWLLRRRQRRSTQRRNFTVQLNALIIQLINERVNTQCLSIYHFISFLYITLLLCMYSNGTCKIVICAYFEHAKGIYKMYRETVYCHGNMQNGWKTRYQNFNNSTLFIALLLVLFRRDQIIFYGALEICFLHLATKACNLNTSRVHVCVCARVCV